MTSQHFIPLLEQFDAVHTLSQLCKKSVALFICGFELRPEVELVDLNLMQPLLLEAVAHQMFRQASETANPITSYSKHCEVGESRA